MKLERVGAPEALALGGFLAPWAPVALLLPDPWRWQALALLGALVPLLLLAGGWSRLRADELGLDGNAWGVAAVLSLGLSVLVLLVRPTPAPSHAFLCGECGRLADARVPFCYGCGA